ncbi:MAG TPA: carboxylating nicotinate-nucleotide diphosphorylase [Gemmatimonadales bacterium]|nr:carboxylating nicotinate-nucleotide diphosphorylase [Gemmatimonadales bacterium]
MAELLGWAEARGALAEDAAQEDVTTRLLGAAALRPAALRFIAEDPCVVAGLPVVDATFRALDPAARLEILVADGARVERGASIAVARASARTLLAGERVALNFLQRLSGIATLTRRVVDAVAHTGARITHTRKTTPGLRALECYAVRAGGGVDNRASLADAVLWKDNHWVLLQGPLDRALAGAPPGVPVMVEVETDAQLEAALRAGVTHLLVDNQTPERLAAWVRRAGPGVTIQASGGISVDNARAYAEAGATLIAIGALTHSAPAAPVRGELE